MTYMKLEFLLHVISTRKVSSVPVPRMKVYGETDVFCTHPLTPALYVGLFVYTTTQCSLKAMRSWLDVPTFATRRLHSCHHARAPGGGRWNCGREISGNFA